MVYFLSLQGPAEVQKPLVWVRCSLGCFDLVEKIHEHGCRFMQLTYNNQSLLATGCYEKNDSGVTNFGKEVIKEMNKLGIVIDMSHSAEKSTFDAIELSEKPIAITLSLIHI